MPTLAVYAFEAKAIQAYIAAGGRLRDMVGGSRLVDGLCRPEGDAETGETPDLLGDVLARMDGDARPIRFARRAGGAFTALAEAAHRPALERLRTLFTAAVQVEAPGLPFIDALYEADGLGAALAARPGALAAARAQVVRPTPRAGPFTRLSPRTGGAAVPPGSDFFRGDGLEVSGVDVTGEEALDAGTLARRVAVALARRNTKRAGGPVGLERRMLPDAFAGCVFPTEMDAAEAPPGAVVFPFSGEDRTVGLVHADGNRLGETLIAVQGALAAVPDAAAGAAFLLALSNAIGAATAQAARDAVADTLEPVGHVLPARPLVLGGDDLTILVRGDRAVDFASAYLLAFEDRTRAALAPVREAARALGGAALEAAVPEAPSAGAGIVLVGANHPLDQAGVLAESLTKFAKGAAKKAASGRPGPPPATLAFHRVTTALADAYGEALEAELTVRTDAGARRLTCNPYRVSGDAPGIAPFEALAEIADVIATEGFPRGPLRRYLGALATTPFQAGLDYVRWREIMEARAGRWLDDFDRALAAFGVPKGAEPFAPGRDGGPPVTPLLDAFALVQIGRRSRRGAPEEKAA